MSKVQIVLASGQVVQINGQSTEELVENTLAWVAGELCGKSYDEIDDFTDCLSEAKVTVPVGGA